MPLVVANPRKVLCRHRERRRRCGAIGGFRQALEPIRKSAIRGASRSTMVDGTADGPDVLPCRIRRSIHRV